MSLLNVGASGGPLGRHLGATQRDDRESKRHPPAVREPHWSPPVSGLCSQQFTAHRAGRGSGNPLKPAVPEALIRTGVHRDLLGDHERFGRKDVIQPPDFHRLGADLDRARSRRESRSATTSRRWIAARRRSQAVRRASGSSSRRPIRRCRFP